MTMVGHRAADVGAGADHPTSWRGPVAAVAVVGAAVCSLPVGGTSFSLDESVSTTLAVSSWHSFTQTVIHREANMSLYFVLLRAWIHLGHSEIVVRALSVLAAVAALVVVMVVARRLFDRRTALICGVLLAVDPLLVMFGQEARGYALSLLLVSTSSALFVRGIQAPAGRGTWAAYALVSALAAYANFWAALVPLAHAVSLAALPRGRVPWRRLVPTFVGLGVLLVPLALLIRSTDNSGVNWAAGSSAGRLISKVRADVPHPVIDIAVVLVVVVTAAVAVALRRHPRTRGLVDHWPVAFALSWLVVPVAAVVLLSLAYKPLLVVRYLVVCLPPLLILVSWGLARLRGRGAVVVAAGLVVASGAGLGVLASRGSPQQWSDAVAAVAARARPGDGVVIFAPYNRIPFEWYLHDHGAAASLLHPLFPAGSWDEDALRYDTSIAVRASAIGADVTGYHRVWVVLSAQQLYPAQDRALLAGLRSAGLAPGPSWSFHGVEVVRYVDRR
ncbi:MAG TPA: glycosyltransferase family 39 protein [Acidimicrobiales bacterium]|nr:glycosyltransferase family 39 protein [Acidimicrobiales bacterium]